MSRSKSFRRIVFWEPTPSPHKFALFEALADLMPDIEVRCVADHALPAERVALGWTVPQAENFHLMLSPSPDAVRSLVEEHVEATVHVFSGIRHIASNVLALSLIRVADAGHCFGLLSEPRVTTDGKAWIRLAQSWWEERWIRQRCAFVLAIGRNGPPWFRRAGYAAHKVFPFAYFLPSPGRMNSSLLPLTPGHDAQVAGCSERAGAPLRIGYLGRLALEKGIQVLLQAVDSSDWPGAAQAWVAGGGDLQARVQAMAGKRASRLHYLGALGMADVPAFLAQLDILVVPSISDNDGWGAVVSEALMCGVLVLATPRVGASVLLEDEQRGRIIRPNDAASINHALVALSHSEALTPQAREVRRQWALRTLTGQRGATYLQSILAHVLGAAPRPADYYSDP